MFLWLAERGVNLSCRVPDSKADAEEGRKRVKPGESDKEVIELLWRPRSKASIPGASPLVGAMKACRCD